ncbi:MAG: methyltransferase [Pseudomonadota bacterium]
MGSDDVTDNAFLGGRVTIRQPAKGYRAGADPVFLAAAVDARPGESVFELGTGVGTALACLNARVPGLSFFGIEREAVLADLARSNAALNGFEADIATGDLAVLPPGLADANFDHVMLNPPYFAEGTASPAPDRRAGRMEDTPLGVWIDTGLKRLRPGGHMTLIHQAPRLPDTLSLIGDRLGAVACLPLAPRAGKPAKLVILSGKKGAKSPFCLLPPFILHRGARHEKDGESYTEAASNVLRDGAKLPLLTDG